MKSYKRRRYNMANVLALKVNDLDNVATVFANDVKAGMLVDI